MSNMHALRRSNANTNRVNRRAFLDKGGLLLSAVAMSGIDQFEALAKESSGEPVLRIGVVTDIHYADKDPQINRFYRESRNKLRESIDRFNQLRSDFIVELGDIIDAADSVETEIGYLETIEAECARFRGDRHYVLGNHCVWALSKKQFFAHCGGREGFYSFDRGPFHFVILDACYRADGESYGGKNYDWKDTDIPVIEREWLRNDLQRTDKPAVIFVHQRLDVANDYAVKTAPLIREVLERSGKVLAVFQGHSHKNDYREIQGIHYCTLRAMVEGGGEHNSGYGMLWLYEDGSIQVHGFREQRQYLFSATR